MSERARIERWAEGDEPLLRALLGDPAMMRHLGGPEPARKIADRHRRYLTGDPQFRIVDVASGEPAGWVGYWAHEHHGQYPPGNPLRCNDWRFDLRG